MFETANAINLETENWLKAELDKKDKRLSYLEIEVNIMKIEAEKKYASLLDKYNKLNAEYD